MCHAWLVSRIVIAPDSFKGSAAAHVAAAAIARGWTSVRAGDALTLLPMADGGEGTIDAFAAAFPLARRMPTTVTGPDDRSVDTEWLLLPGATGVVELAGASGLTLLDPLLPSDAHTLGFGQLIAAALDHGVSRLLLGIGGSSSTDGGAAALVALGARLLDASGSPIALGNRGLADLVTADLSQLRALPSGGAAVLSDVTNPLLGPLGAAAVFGPQKGATAANVETLDANLARFASIVGGDPDVSGAGAAGGAGFGLLAWGASISAGSSAIGGALGMPAAVASADLVITGEGRFDVQSAAGKVPSYLTSLASVGTARVALIAGLIEASTDGFVDAVSLTELAGSSAAAQRDAEDWLVEAGAELARRY
ncbi:MAG: glycerate 2-kinase [Actinomycetota bacterium]|nr:glycerate 2-kinase [Actinomycetota bacterium]